jgi:hypothetical protein
MTEKNREKPEQENAKLANDTSDEEERTVDFENQFLYPTIEPHYRNDVK